jgi:hypothetical protein
MRSVRVNCPATAFVTDTWREQVTREKNAMRKDETGRSWVPGKFLHPHDACFDAAGNIFVAEWVHTGRITKLRKLS